MIVIAADPFNDPVRENLFRIHLGDPVLDLGTNILPGILLRRQLPMCGTLTLRHHRYNSDEYAWRTR